MDPLRALTVSPWAAVPGLIHGFGQREAPAEGTSRESARRRVSQALAGRCRVLFLRQVHGTKVCAAPWEGAPEGDAALAREPGFVLGIETADCLPVLIVDRKRQAVAVAHAGWRGTAAAVSARAVEALVASGSQALDLEAALGPCIGPCCYEVGDEVREAFARASEAVFRAGPRGRAHLDLRAANALQLEQAGVPRDGIQSIAHCTCCRPDLYHSYRRDGSGTGRMISFAGFAPP